MTKKTFHMGSMTNKSTVWKAQWPLSGEPFCLIYDADTRERQSMVPATQKLFDELFQEKYVRVFFEGSVNGDGTVTIDKLVREDQWLPLPDEHVQPTSDTTLPDLNWAVVSRSVLNHKSN